MDKELFDELESNLKEAVELVKGKSKPKSVYFALSAATNYLRLIKADASHVLRMLAA